MATHQPTRAGIQHITGYGGLKPGYGDQDETYAALFSAMAGIIYGAMRAQQDAAKQFSGSTYKPGLPSFEGSTYQQGCTCGTCPVHSKGMGGLESEVRGKPDYSVSRQARPYNKQPGPYDEHGNAYGA